MFTKVHTLSTCDTLTWRLNPSEIYLKIDKNVKDKNSRILNRSHERSF